MDPSTAHEGPEMSVEEWLNLPEDDEGELVSGRLEDEEVPDAVHELVIAWLVMRFGPWLSGRGFVFGSELKVLTGSGTGRKPDLTFFLPGTPAPPRQGPIRRPPDIVVEVITPSPRDERRDRVVKMQEYAQFRVQYYWLIDPALGTFEIFELTAQGLFQQVIGVTSGMIDSVPGCAGLKIDVDALWGELARLDQEQQ
jgi:Uma2 family endonuclease